MSPAAQENPPELVYVPTRFRQAEPEQEIDRAKAVLELVDQVAGTDCAPLRMSNLDLRSADLALSSAEELLTSFLRPDQPGMAETTESQCSAVLMQLGVVRASIKDAVMARRSAVVDEVRQSLSRMRETLSVAELMERIPREISNLGFRRTMLSRIAGSEWRAQGAFVDGDPEMAVRMVSTGQEYSKKLDANLVETEMARRRVPILVSDPQSNPHVHRELKKLIDTQGYVGAPVVSRNSVVGFVHADENRNSQGLDEFDKDLLMMFAEGIWFAVERAVFYQRLQDLREQLNEHTRSVNDLVDQFMYDAVEFSSCDEKTLDQERSRGMSVKFPPSSAHMEVASVLTTREFDVLRQMAFGKTNSQIANVLFLTEGTVKTHVKHILRKLQAANRAEAVSRCYGLFEG